MYESHIRDEADYQLIMRQPFTMTCTDGDLVPFGQGKPHPRGNGAFARKIRVYALVNGVIEKDGNAFTGKLGGRVVSPDRR